MNKGTWILITVASVLSAFYLGNKCWEIASKNKILRNENNDLRNENNNVSQQNNSLRQQNTTVIQENQELKNRVSKLPANSELPPQTA